VGVDIREEVLQRPIHVLSISAITGGMGASAEKALEEARRNARDRPWEIDIGSFQRMVEEHQAMRIMEMCRQEGIPFWERRWLNAHLALTLPDALPREYQEICEIFGVPVPAVTDEQTMSS
jgi:type III secretion system FlhB-like substrate exporter